MCIRDRIGTLLRLRDRGRDLAGNVVLEVDHKRRHPGLLADAHARRVEPARVGDHEANAAVGDLSQDGFGVVVADVRVLFELDAELLGRLLCAEQTLLVPAVIGLLFGGDDCEARYGGTLSSLT